MTASSVLQSWQKGEIARVKVQMRAFEKGAMLSQPLGADARYDMIVDWCGKLYRAQIKYAGGVNSKTQATAVVSLNKGDHGERRHTSDEIDVLLVYVPATDQVCWFGPEIFHAKTQLHIRHSASKNGQKKGCVLIENYVW